MRGIVVGFKIEDLGVVPWGFPADQLRKPGTIWILYELSQNATASAKFWQEVCQLGDPEFYSFTKMNKAPHISEDHHLLLQLFDSSFLLGL